MKTKYRKQILFTLISIVAALGGFLFGFDTAVISGTLLFVQKQFTMNAITEGWFVSSALVGSIAGAAIAGVLSDKFGRKKILLLSGILFAITALGCMLATSVTELVIYRFLGGLGIGIASIISPMYLSEIFMVKYAPKVRQTARC